MATEVVQNSAFFPFGNKGQEENKAPVTRTALISFPQTRQILWDSAKIGSGMKLYLSSGRIVSVKISEKTIRLAYQHAAHEKGSQYHGFVVGNVDTDAEEEGIEVTLSRFDPGRELPSGQGSVLTAKLPGDFVVPICFSFLKGDKTQTHGEKEFLSAFKFLEHSTSSREAVDLSTTLSLRIHCLCYEGSDDITFSLHIGAVTVGTPVEVWPINSIPVIPTALARNLAGPVSISQLQNNHKSGFITMDQTRKLLLLLDTDPKAYSLPLVGVWVSGVNYVHSPVVYAACLKFIFSKSIQDRATSPSSGFVLLLYSPMHKHPLFFECEKGDTYHNLVFDLIGCKEQLHLYRHADSTACSDVHFELTAARDGPSKELFLQASRRFDPSSGSFKSQTGTPTSLTNSDPHLVPRPSPKPTLMTSPSILSSVPEVSLIFDDTENTTPGKRSSPFVGPARPGPLRDLNQSQAELKMRTSVISTQHRRFSASSAQGHLGMDEGKGGFDRRKSCGNSTKNCERDTTAPGVPAGGKERKKRGNNSKKSKNGGRSRDQGEMVDRQDGQDGYRDLPDQRVKSSDGGLQQLGLLSRQHGNDWHREKQEDVLTRGRFDQQGKGVSPLMGHALQNQTHPSAMPQGGTPPSWGRIKRHQSESNLGRVMTDASPQLRQPVSNYGYSPLQRDDKRCQYEDPSHYSDSETHPPRLQGSYSTSCGLRQSPGQNDGQTGCTLQSGQPLSLLQQDQPVQQPVAASQQHQSQQKQLSPNQARLQHQTEQLIPSSQQHQSLRQHSPPNQSRLTHVQQPVATSQQHQQQQPLQQQSLPHQQSLLSHQQPSLSHQQLSHGQMNGNSGDSCREESAFVQLKKQEKMIEQLQEQIKYLLQLQTGSISSGLMTPPTTPPSTNVHPGFPFPSPNSSAGKEMGSMDTDHPKREVGHVSGPESLLPKQMATISTNTGQSLFFPESPLRYSTHGRRGGSLSPNSGSPNSREEDAVPNTASRDSSIPGSVSDTAVSTDPDFHVELENVHDDTNSLGKVEIRSFPDSGSAKSSPQSSPPRGHGQCRVRTPHSESPGSGDNTMVTSPPMPTLISPVLGESASTYQPQRFQQQSLGRNGSRPNMREGPVWRDAIPEESSEDEFANRRQRLQSPSLLQRDEKQFYQNLLGQVENFLQDDKDCQRETRDESSKEDDDDDDDTSCDDDDTSSDDDDTSCDDDEEMVTHGDGGRSLLYRSILCSPDVHPHINYVSLADFGLGPSDMSMEADAIAMKYLSDEELAKISSEMNRGGLSDGVSPLLRNVLTSGIPARLLNEKSTVKSRVEFSFATRKYLEKHGLGETAERGEADRKKKSRKKRRRKVKKITETPGRENKQPDFERILQIDGQEDGREVRQRAHPGSGEQGVSVGNILDFTKLKTLPKLF